MDDQQRKAANLNRKSIIVRFAAALRQKARGAVLFEVVQQAEHLTPPQTDQCTSIGDAEPARLNAHHNLKRLNSCLLIGRTMRLS